MMLEKKFYKVLSKDLRAKDGGDFDYSDYVDNGDWLPMIDDVSICNKGYHVTEFWNMWVDNESNRVFEVEPKDLQENSEVGVVDKFVCKSFKFIKELKLKYDTKSNTGNCNTGYSNTGDRNTGYRNTGYSNTGDRNTGNRNTGNRNTGDSNTGYSNTGNRNTGDSNTGNRNTGYSNTGDRNTGYRNTGNCNTGTWNTGYSNTGNCNTGNWNTGNCNTGNWNTGYRNTGNCNTGNKNTGNWNVTDFETGFFNTKQSKYINVFNKPCLRNKWEKCIKPNFISFVLKDDDYKESFKKSFNNASKEEVLLLLSLPNFCFKVFEEVSGISKKMINKKLKGEKE